MGHELIREMTVFRDHRALSEAAAECIAKTAVEAVAERGRCAMALCGGKTPREAYALVAERHVHRIRWACVHVFFSDERCVPPADPESNYRMAREALLDRVPIPPENVHRIHGARPPEIAAGAYEEALRGYFGREVSVPVFDLVLLGMGAEGHTASLFPGSQALHEVSRWAVAVCAPEGFLSPDRVTLTLPALNAARQVLFLVSGSEKAPLVKAVLNEAPEAARLPAAMVHPSGRLLWFLDHAAAAVP